MPISRPTSLSVAYGIALFGLSLIYRATFINQGYNATDEGWLQSIGARIVAGQMPYRDFYFGSPPVSIYEQAALIQVFGQGYGILASRWVFSVEVALASVLAFVILLRYVRPTVAFLITLPTCCFSVVLFYFTNYSYDGEVLALLSLALLVHAAPGRRVLAVLGGLAGALAFMAKPTFLGLLPIIVLAALAGAWAERKAGEHAKRWTGIRGAVAPYITGFVLGCLLTFAYFAAEGIGSQFVSKALLVPRQTFPLPLTFVFWQDLPEWMLFWPNVAGYIAALIVLGLVIRVGLIPDYLRLGAVAAILLFLLYRALPSATDGLPTARQNAVLLAAIGILLLLNLAAIGLALFARPDVRGRLFPPELPVMALGLQYLAQFNAAGVRFSYYGTFLSIPVALLVLHRLSGLASPIGQRGDLSIGISKWAALLVGVAIALTAIVDTHGVVFRDGPRSQLTSSFQTPLLAGIRSRPDNTARVDGVVAAVMSLTQPGDTILAMPDFPAIYFLTGRRNPTPIGWYEAPQVSAAQAQEVVAVMAKNPPKIVILQTYDEDDFLHTRHPIDYRAQPHLRPIYEFILANYRSVAKVGDLVLYVPAAGP